MRFRDLVGQKFGRLVVMRVAERNQSKRYMWECLCDCGATCKVDGGALARGNTQSCGCYLRERITKHGGSGKASYNTWRAMMRRCYKITDKDFARYGGMGVVVAAEWHDYTVFVHDMGEPSGAQTLDRIDPYGNYTPENCRWASKATQARNIRSRHSVSGHRGIYLTSNGKWMAAITVGYKKYYRPCRGTVEEALADRKELEALHWKDT